MFAASSFSHVVSLALTKPRNSSRRVTLRPVYSTKTLHTRRLVHVFETSVASSPIKYSEILHALAIFHVTFRRSVYLEMCILSSNGVSR